MTFLKDSICCYYMQFSFKKSGKTKQKDRRCAECHAEGLLFGKFFLEDDETCKDGEQKCAAVDEGEEDYAGHNA